MVNIRQFDITNISDIRTVLIIGNKNTGKRTLVRDLLYQKKYIPTGMVISNTDNDFYSNIMPSSFIHNTYCPTDVETFINQQMETYSAYWNDILQNKKVLVKPKSFFIIDDINDSSIYGDASCNYIVNYGRHNNIFSVFLAEFQYAVNMPVSMRINIDYVFIYYESSITKRKKLFEKYCGMFETFEEFSQIMDNLMKYECLVIDNTTKSNKLEDMVFTYRAEMHAPFKLDGITPESSTESVPEASTESVPEANPEPVPEASPESTPSIEAIPRPETIIPTTESIPTDESVPVLDTVTPEPDTYLGSIYKYVCSFF